MLINCQNVTLSERFYLHKCIIYKCILIVCYVFQVCFSHCQFIYNMLLGQANKQIITIRSRYIMPQLSSNNTHQHLTYTVLTVTSPILHPLPTIPNDKLLIPCYSLVLSSNIQCEDSTSNPIHRLKYCFITIYYYQLLKSIPKNTPFYFYQVWRSKGQAF